MEEMNKYSNNNYVNNKDIKFFFEKFSKERNKIFECIYDLLEKKNYSIKENKIIKEIINQKDIEIDEKIQKIKIIKMNKYLKNLKSYGELEELKKYNLGLIYHSYPVNIKLAYYGNCEESKNNGNQEIDDKNNLESDNVKYNKYEVIDENKNEKKIDDKRENLKIMLDIDFITKIKINEDEEWICNSEYALYLIYIMKNLKNPHPTIFDEEVSDDSSYSLTDKFNFEHFVFITNNKDDVRKKNVIEFEADLNISSIYEEIKTNGYFNCDIDYNEYIKYSIPNINIKDITQYTYYNNEIYRYFKELDTFYTMKHIIFQDENALNSYYKIVLLNSLYFKEKIRYLYLDLNILNKINNTNEKRKYLSYYIARIYNRYRDFKEDFETFVNENLKNIRDKNFINNFIDKVIEENNRMEKENEDTPLYIIIDNIDNETNFNIFKKLLNTDKYTNIYIYIIINIDTKYGKSKFLQTYNKKYNEREGIGCYVHYLCSNNNENINENIFELQKFFYNIGNSINTLKDFIQLIYFKEYNNECSYINYDFLMEYIKYIKLIISEDNYNCLYIKDIKFKSEEIKNKFILNYKNILLSYLNKDNDENITKLFSDLNGIFFEKQIILDVLLDKIKTDCDRNFKELNVHSIYCMNFDIDKINISQYKDKDIVIIQDSITGEIYDFGIIINNSIKLYQVSIKKSKEDLLKLNRILIEADCNYMMTNCLNNIGNYENFSFGIITSKSTFNEYSLLIKEKNILENKEKEIKNLENIKKKIEKTSYNLMKAHCKKNKYELLVYDLKKKEVYIEDDTNELIEYNLYKFQIENKLNIPKLENIFGLKPIKFSIKNFQKDKFIEKLKETKLFSGLEKKDNENSLNIVGKLGYKKEFLSIKEIEEDNYFMYISGRKRRENKKIEILKYKNETIINEILREKRILCENNNNLDINKKDSEVILFSLEEKITFLGIKRKINSEE